MADVLMNNQRDAPSAAAAEHKNEVKIATREEESSAATSGTSSDNQLIHEEIEEVHATGAKPDVDIDEEDVERRLTWIGEGLLDGEGLQAVQQLMKLPTSPQKSSDIAKSTQQHEPTDNQPEHHTRVECSGSKLLDFLAKEEGYTLGEKPSVAPINRQAPPPKPETAAPKLEEKRQNKLLDFLATDAGERYLDGLYTEDDSDDELHKETPVQTKQALAEAASAAGTVQNNKLIAFLARERGERVHDVEKVEVDEAGQPRRSEPYFVTIRIETSETAAAAQAAEEAVRGASPEPTNELTSIRELDEAGNPIPTQSSTQNNKLKDFVKNVQPARPKFVLFNPEDLVTSSSGSETEEGSPLSNPKDFRLKKRSQQAANRVRFANPGLDLQTGVIRQAVTDHYGREELLDFAAQVEESTAVASIERAASPTEPQLSGSPDPQQPESPPPCHESPSLRQPSPHLRRDSQPARKESPVSIAPPSARKPDGRLVSFLKKFSSKSKSGSDSGSHHGSRSNSPEIDTRYSAPPHQQESQHVHLTPTPFVARTSVESDQHASTPLEAKLANRDSFEPSPSPRSVLSASDSGEPSSKRIALLISVRQLLEDCEKNELSDVSMVRISILLSTVNQIVRDDVRKERPAQTIMRRLSTHASGAQNGLTTATQASWVRSNKEQEEYERGHTVTTSDIAPQLGKKSHSPEPRASSPQQTLLAVEEPVGDSAMTSFTQFETSQNVVEIIEAFDKLLSDLGISESAARTPLRVYSHVKSALYIQFSFRQKQLFRLLDSKLSVDVYRSQPCLHRRVCVVGAGPVGLRAAVELALLGGHVVVIDKRKVFNRENILHMWPWVVQDLTSLGAKVFFPQFCHSSAYFHVGTRQIQCILLKVALLLGVKFYPGTSFEGLASPDSIVSERKPFYTVVTKPQIPWQEFTSVFGACGSKDKVAAHAGIKRFVFSRKEAIGLVCYFPNLGTNEEKKVNEFSWTIQFKQRMFAKMREIGIDLENVVYYRGEYHYIVMTPKRTNLLQQGVLKINYPSVSDLVAVDNIDPGALNDYVSRIINFFEIPQKSEFARVRLFDFSTRTRTAQAANVLTSRGKKLYVGLIGDALMEPFWPEGLGTCRGFLSAMDACWMVSQIGKQSDEQILADRELGYRIMQHISGFQRDDLQKNVRKYNVDPTSRYNIQYPATITF